MKPYLALICSALLVGAFCAVLAAPGGNLNDEPQPEPALIFPAYSINPQDKSVSISESVSNSDSSSSSSSESSSEENDDGAKPEGRTLFLLLRLLQLLSQSNSTSSG